MTPLEQYRALNDKYNNLVIELKNIQLLEDAKKKEIVDLIKTIKLFLDKNS